MPSSASGSGSALGPTRRRADTRASHWSSAGRSRPPIASTIRDHVADIARGLGIPGHAAAPVRTYHALDLRSVDETEVLDRRGRTLAVIRTDATSGALRSVVRLDWTRDADRPRVDGSTAAEHARRQARLGGLAVPAGEPNVRWDDPMDAWRVDWPRRVDGHVAIGDGLTVWVHRGGQLAALHQAETATAPAPPVQIEPEKAIAIVRAWAQRSGVPDAGLIVVAAADPVWVHPNDFLVRGGADDVDARLYLAHRIDLTMTMPDGTNHHVAIFVDVGSGALIAGVETA